jgi:hypothetical protein
MCLLEDLDAFYLEHRGCGELKAHVLEVDAPICRVGMACSCGARLNREDAPARDRAA